MNYIFGFGLCICDFGKIKFWIEKRIFAKIFGLGWTGIPIL